jgi:hypothetical protein
MVFVPTVLRNSIQNKLKDYGTNKKNKVPGSGLSSVVLRQCIEALCTFPYLTAVPDLCSPAEK